MKVKPLDDRVLVQPTEDKAGTIILVNPTQDKKPRKGIIVEKADDVEVVKIGDVIYFGEYAGEEIVVADEKLLLISMPDILAKIVD